MTKRTDKQGRLPGPTPHGDDAEDYGCGCSHGPTMEDGADPVDYTEPEHIIIQPKPPPFVTFAPAVDGRRIGIDYGKGVSQSIVHGPGVPTDDPDADLFWQCPNKHPVWIHRPRCDTCNARPEGTELVKAVRYQEGQIIEAEVKIRLARQAIDALQTF
jgi:hypothetical protein